MSDMMPRKTSATLRDEALDWVIRLREAKAADWQAFEQWMAADTRAADIYWELAAADVDVAEALTRPRPETPVRSLQVRAPNRKWIVGSMLALAASILLLLFVQRADGRYAVETPPGATHSIAMDDGSAVLLGGGSKLILDHGDPRSVRLDGGDARFTVAHDAAKPFRVHVGEAVLVDLGTVFSVTWRNGALRVEVAEGAVRYSRNGLTHDLGAGDTLRIGVDGRIVSGRVDPVDVAAWAEGRLVYSGTEMAAVAADLSRATGIDVAVDPAVAAHLFSGGFALGNRDAETVRRAASLMGLRARPNGNRWILEAPASGAR